MKRRLTEADVRAAVWGGAILGGGGGGFVAAGLQAGELALKRGQPELWSVDELPPDAITATVAMVGAPGAPNPQVLPEHQALTVELLRQALGPETPLAGLYTNENGAQTTVNGWLQAAMLGLPVLDLACNGRAHPTGLMGAMGLHTEPGYRSIQAFAGGLAHEAVSGLLRGPMLAVASLVRQASVHAQGVVAVTRNPVSAAYAQRHGAPGAISFAIALGHAWLAGAIEAAAAHLGGRLVAAGPVSHYRCAQQDGLDIGEVVLGDALRTTLPFINEYMFVQQGSQRRAEFPDLITTVDQDGKPVASADVRPGDWLRVLHVPRARLPLSRTMSMPELFEPLQARLGSAFESLNT